VALPSGQVEERTAAQPAAEPEASVPLTSLLRKLAEEGQALVRQEIALAKAEVRESVNAALRSAGLLVGGVTLIAVGLVVLLVFVILALGVLLGGRYWLSTLLVGMAFALSGLLLLRRGQSRLQQASVVPERTVETLQETADWATAEARRITGDKS
jgi:hypothetical protein